MRSDLFDWFPEVIKGRRAQERKKEAKVTPQDWAPAKLL